MEWEEKNFFVYMAVSAHHVILKEVEDPSLNTITFLDTHVCINNPHWQSSWILSTALTYIRFQTSGWESNGNTRENIYWSLLFHGVTMKHIKTLIWKKTVWRNLIQKLLIEKFLNTLHFASIKSEAATGAVLLKRVLLKILQNSQENTCARLSFVIKLQA